MKLSILATAVLVAGLIVSASAKDHGKGHGHEKDHETKIVIKNDHGTFKRFASKDRDIIIQYYVKEKKHKRLPPGLAKKLPREIEQKIVINTIAPPQVMQAMLPLPPVLLPLLPPPPPGVLLMTVSGKVCQVDVKTNMVLDVFDLGL